MKSLGNKMLKIIATISFLSLSILVLVNFIVFNILFTKIQNELKNTVVTATNSINGDKLREVMNKKSMDSYEYKEVQNEMIKWKNDKSINYFYTLGKKDENTGYYLVDSSLIDPEEVGSEYPLEEEMKEAFDGEATYTRKPYKDDLGTFISAYIPIKDSTGKVIAIAGIDKDVAYFVAIRETILMSIIVAAVIIMILSILSTLVFSRKVSSNVGEIKEALNKMAQGDLNITLSIQSKDEFEEIAKAINEFSTKCGDTIRVIKDTSSKLVEDSESLSAVSEEMAASSEMVSSSVEDVTNSSSYQAEEVLSMDNNLKGFGIKINEAVNAVNGINSRVQNVNSKAIISSEDLSVLDKSIKDISGAFNVVSDKINELSMNLSQVNEITGLINSIAEQTNLLALNAAIEAARAGDAGRGFSVVAEEIRKLAEQSKESSEGINKLIGRISKDNLEVMNTSKNMSCKLDNQIQIINNSMTSFIDIIDNIEEVSEMITKVNSNINSLNHEKDKILQGVENVTKGAQEVSAYTEEILASSQELSSSTQEVAASSQELRKKAEDMIEAVNHFNV
ncbi:methyl-accepting chemotaxis protein [Clostridium sp.]|uniref:methyl-accepting chemotaxis protein n=1 Tax=Clostridium sp. TaxID=1506 RepID=UPI002FCC0178